MRFPPPFAAMLLLAAAIAAPATTHAADGNAHQFGFVSIEGDPMPLAGFKGQAVLVVNTASFCGFTPQYKALQALYDRYRENGLVVLGVPSNDFGSQEPGSEEDIKEFCETHYDITFPLTEKQAVKGRNAHPFYRWAREALGVRGTPRWNFHKILIGPDGAPVDAWPTATKPDATAVVSAIQTVLDLPNS